MSLHLDHRRLRAEERLDHARRRADAARLAAEARRRHRPSLRRALAFRLISIGERLAAEPNLASVRPS